MLFQGDLKKSLKDSPSFCNVEIENPYMVPTLKKTSHLKTIKNKRFLIQFQLTWFAPANAISRRDESQQDVMPEEIRQNLNLFKI